jgi:hypothetical protein
MKSVLDPTAVKHVPVFDTKKAISFYENKDGVPIKYVCTTDLLASDLPVDIFYRKTPHPEFGNRYFGLYKNPYANDARIMITNADAVETSKRYIFGVIEDKDGLLWYSQCHHDCLFIDGSMIDGGREYIRSTNLKGVFKIVDGEFVERLNLEDEDEEWLGQDSGIEDFTNY